MLKYLNNVSAIFYWLWMPEFNARIQKFSLKEKTEGFYLFVFKITVHFLSILSPCILLPENLKILLQDGFISTILRQNCPLTASWLWKMFISSLCQSSGSWRGIGRRKYSLLSLHTSEAEAATRVELEEKQVSPKVKEKQEQGKKKKCAEAVPCIVSFANKIVV